MNKLFKQAAVAVTLFFAAASSNAVPLYYTFTGELGVGFDSADRIAELGLNEGDTVEHTWLMDLDVVLASDRDLGAQLVSGNILADFSNETVVDEYQAAQLFGFDMLQVTTGGELITSTMGQTDGWYELGSTWSLEEYYEDFSTGLGTMIFSAMTLTSISETFIADDLDVSPVPLPAGLPLFAAGLAGLFGLRRKKLAAAKNA